MDNEDEAEVKGQAEKHGKKGGAHKIKAIMKRIRSRRNGKRISIKSGGDG